MARVVLTSQLKRDLLNKIQSKYQSQRATLLREFLEKNREAFYRLAVSDELEAQLNKLPAGFHVKNSSMNFTFNGHSYDVNLQRDRFLPVQYHSSYSRTRLELPPALAEEAKEMEAKRAQLHKESESVCDELTKVMEKAETLKQLVTVWPSALDLCDSDVIQRYNRGPKPRKQKEELTLSDESKLALVKVRMT